MILLLTTRGKTRTLPALAALDTVRTVRVPPEPATAQRKTIDDGPRSTRPDRPDPDWAFRRLKRLGEVIAHDQLAAVVCADSKAHPFALLLAEQHPDIPVLPDQQVAARILAELASRGEHSTRRAVHDLLDPLRLTPPAVPRYLFDRGCRPPLIVSLVQNAIDGDSRVQKVAASLADAGYQSVLLGINPPAEPDGDWYPIGRAIVLRLPVTRQLHQALKDSPPASLPTRLFGYRDAEADRAAWQRHQRRIERAPADAGPGLTTRISGRVIELRSWLYQRNRRSFTSAEHRSGSHRWRAAAVTSRRSGSDPESAYPLIADVEETMGPALDELKPDAIHVHDPMLLGIAVRARNRLQRLGLSPPIVFDAHEWTAGIQRDHAFHVPALLRLEREFVPEAAATITVSDQIAELMVAEYQLPKRPTVVLNAPPGKLDVGFTDVRTECGIPASAPLIVYVGVLAERRGLEDLVAALAELPGAHVVLVSPRGQRLRLLRQQARDLGVAARLHHLDYVAADKVSSYIRTADVGVFPLRPIVNSELGIPTKFREYLVAGLPIVATDIGATAAEVRRTGVGELCPPGNPRSLAQAIQTVLNDPQRYRSKITPQLRAENTWETQSRGLFEVYEPLVGAPQQRERAGGVLIGGTNSAGQAREWARALRMAGVDATSLELRSPDNAFAHEVDRILPRSATEGLSRKVQVLLNEVIDRDAVILESGVAIAAPEPGRVGLRLQGFREARALAGAGRRVALVFHGSDLRRPDVHLRTHPWSPFADPRAAAMTAELRKRTRVAHEQLASWEGPVMVSTPDLIHATPGAVWTPVVIDLERFPAANREWNGAADKPPVVLHLPSRSLLKGSHLIEPILRGLSQEGVIRYRRIERVPHESVPELLAECDIFVDQLGMGILGVAPVEAMATGAVVVTDPGPEAMEVYGEEPPIVAVDPSTLADEIRKLATDVDRRRRLSESGRDFVIRHHDGRRSAAAMIGALGLDVPARSDGVL